MGLMEDLFERALHLEKPWVVESVNLKESEKLLEIRLDFPKGSVFPCPVCGSDCKAYDTSEKRWRHFNFFEHECHLIARVPRIQCEKDGVSAVDVPWARERSGFTLLYEALLMMLAGQMPILGASRLTGVTDDRIWRVAEHYVGEAREYADYSETTRIGIDETSIRRGHTYVTTVVDLDEKKVVYVTEGKGGETIESFVHDFMDHSGDIDNLTDISMDMSPAFISGADENLPHVGITFDRFHVMKIVNDAVDKVRRAESATTFHLKKLRYVFLKNRSNLTASQRKSLDNLESMPKLNLKTMRAFHMRENFQEIYRETDRILFARGLSRWYFWATHSKLPPMIEAARTIKRHWNGVLRWFDSRINNGIVEGMNGLIQGAKARARGYRTMKNFTTIIYLLLGKLDYSLAGLPT